MLNILCLDLHFDVIFQLLNLLVFRYVAEFYKSSDDADGNDNNNKHKQYKAGQMHK